jgi:hypothetical protein
LLRSHFGHHSLHVLSVGICFSWSAFLSAIIVLGRPRAIVSSVASPFSYDNAEITQFNLHSIIRSIRTSYFWHQMSRILVMR